MAIKGECGGHSVMKDIGDLKLSLLGQEEKKGIGLEHHEVRKVNGSLIYVIINKLLYIRYKWHIEIFYILTFDVK